MADNDCAHILRIYSDITQLVASVQKPRRWSGRWNLKKDIKTVEFDLCGFVCPLSKMKATELIDNLADGESVKIALGDAESLKSVVQELKARGIKPWFDKEADNRFVLSITK